MSDAHEDRTGGWQPIPQSEGYDGDATAFVQLPPDFMLDGVPLEAPGHGYVPPMITPLTPLTPMAATDPAATGSWMMQTPSPEPVAPEQVGPEPVAPQQVGPEPVGPEDPQEQTASWTIPTIGDGLDFQDAQGIQGIQGVQGVQDVRDDSGEYAASRLAQYASDAPATLPGGAAAPWAEPMAAEAPEERAAEPPADAPAADVPATDVPAPTQVQATDIPATDIPATDISASGIGSDLPLDGVSADMSTDSDEHPHTSYTLRVNGADRPVTDSWIGESLLYVLRERLGLAGAKDGCSQGECGACNVQVDGRLVASCLVPAATAEGCEVRTVEGLAENGEPSDVQRALAKCGVQCGFCIPGMAMTVHDLLEGNHAPNELETRQALCGNLCRCSGYRGVLDAVREVVEAREAAAEAEAGEEARIPHQIPHPYDGGAA